MRSLATINPFARRLVTALPGRVLIIAGFLISLTVIGALIGRSLMALRFLLIIRGLSQVRLPMAT